MTVQKTIVAAVWCKEALVSWPLCYTASLENTCNVRWTLQKCTQAGGGSALKLQLCSLFPRLPFELRYHGWTNSTRGQHVAELQNSWYGKHIIRASEQRTFQIRRRLSASASLHLSLEATNSKSRGRENEWSAHIVRTVLHSTVHHCKLLWHSEIHLWVLPGKEPHERAPEAGLSVQYTPNELQ